MVRLKNEPRQRRSERLPSKPTEEKAHAAVVAGSAGDARPLAIQSSWKRATLTS